MGNECCCQGRIPVDSGSTPKERNVYTKITFEKPIAKDMSIYIPHKEEEQDNIPQSTISPKKPRNDGFFPEKQIIARNSIDKKPLEEATAVGSLDEKAMTVHEPEIKEITEPAGPAEETNTLQKKLNKKREFIAAKRIKFKEDNTQKEQQQVTHVAKDMPKKAKSIVQRAALLEAHMLNKKPSADIRNNEAKETVDQYIKLILDKPIIKTRTKTKVSRVHFPADIE